MEEYSLRANFFNLTSDQDLIFDEFLMLFIPHNNLMEYYQLEFFKGYQNILEIPFLPMNSIPQNKKYDFGKFDISQDQEEICRKTKIKEMILGEIN